MKLNKKMSNYVVVIINFAVKMHSNMCKFCMAANLKINYGVKIIKIQQTNVKFWTAVMGLVSVPQMFTRV